MGFDVIGQKPNTERGEYFRNNVWWWRPLWHFVARHCRDILGPEDIKGGSFNEGRHISCEKARAIGLRLKFLIDQREVRKFEAGYKRWQENLPDETCGICKGTGLRNDEYVKGACNGCQGKGKTRPWAAHYPFSEENVLEFAEFCLESGGFEIW